LASFFRHKLGLTVLDAEMHPGGLIRALPYFGNSNAK
jgi:hypothetical protein